MNSASDSSQPESLSPASFRTLSDAQWQSLLSPQEYTVLRKGGTEAPFTGQYWDHRESGAYTCRGCGGELFTSEEKFDSHCGWPSFYAPADSAAVEYVEDTSLGMKRIEVRCANCGGHLGHVFEGEGYPTPTDLRFCINSVSMGFTAGDSSADSSRA